MSRVVGMLIAGVVVVMAFVFALNVVMTRFTPQREIMLMQANMAGLTSLAYDAGFGWGDVTVYVRGKREEGGGKSEYDAKFRVVQLGGREYKDLSGELRQTSTTTYLSYTPPAPEISGVDFENGTWVSFAPGELRLWGDILPGIELPLRSMTPGEPWTDEGIARLRTLLAVTDVLLVENNGLTEIIDGQATRILDGRFDSQAIEAFLTDLVRAKYAQEPNEQERILAHEQAKVLSGLRLRLWIGMRDHLLYRVVTTGEIDSRVDFSRFNQPVTVDQPDGIIVFDELYRSTFGSLPTAAKTFVREEVVTIPTARVTPPDDPDGDGLDNVLETFYGTSKSNPDTDGDGVNDGAEVRASTNPRGRGSLFGFGLD